MDDKSFFNEEAWEQEDIPEESLSEFLSTPSASSASSAPSTPSASSASSLKKKSKKKEGHSTDDSTRWCRLCHRKPCDYITKAALAVTKKPMPKRWDLDPTSSGDGAGAVVVNRHPPTDDATAVKKYNPKMTMVPAGLLDDEIFQRSRNPFGTRSPLVPTLPGEDFSGLDHDPWLEQDKLGQDFPGVLKSDRDPNGPFGMGGSNKSSKKAYNKLKRSSRKSSKKSKRKSSRKARKSSRK